MVGYINAEIYIEIKSWEIKAYNAACFWNPTRGTYLCEVEMHTNPAGKRLIRKLI
jgi:hypothetical protein